MRKLLAIVAVVLTALVVLPAPVAQAYVRAKDCSQVHHYRADLDVTERIQVCVMVNVHDLLGVNEGLATMEMLEGFSPSRTDVYVDYLKLFRNDNVVQQTNPDRWYDGAISGGFKHSTDWSFKCYPRDGDYQSEFRFRIRWSNGDVSSYLTRRSNVWNDPDDCPI